MSESLVVSNNGNFLASGCDWVLLTVKNPPNVDDFFILKILRFNNIFQIFAKLLQKYLALKTYDAKLANMKRTSKICSSRMLNLTNRT